MALPFPLLLALASGPELVAQHVGTPPDLDGRLTEEVWQNARKTAQFTQKFPDEGKPPTERTEVAVLYDDEALYIGVWCHQTRAPVVGQLTRRDRDTQSDKVAVYIDSRFDRKTAMAFQVNAAGVMVDALLFDDTDMSLEWDETWDAHTAITNEGWTAEMRIPLRVLRFVEQPENTFGFQVRRSIAKGSETDEWAFIPRTDAAEVSRYGRLTGLTNLKGAGGFEVRPFIAARLQRFDREGDVPLAEPTLVPTIGADIKWHPSQAITLDATLRPDFGQVEADQVFLNLSSYETFLPEKRPFFQEGLDIFATPLSVVYTRRIGYAPYLPSLPDDEEPLTSPEPAPILGATKLTGDLGHGLNVGQLSAIVGHQTIETRTNDGHFERQASPLTSYNALRLRQTLDERVQVGLVATAVKRFDPGDSHPTTGADGRVTLCPDGDEVPHGQRCSNDAYAMGLDASYRSESGDYGAKAQVVGSMIHHGPDRELPDGNQVTSGDTGAVGYISAGKEGGALRFSGTYRGASRDADLNDLGYLRRPNLHEGFGYVEYRTTTPVGPVQDTSTTADGYFWRNADGLNLNGGFGLQAQVALKNHWSTVLRVDHDVAHYEDREVGDGTATPRPSTVSIAASFDSDPAPAVSGWLWNRLEHTSFGLRYYLEANLTLRPLSQLDLSLQPSLELVDDDPRYAETTDLEHIFRERRVETTSLTLRATYTFTPELSIQAYAQAFLASVRYGATWSVPVALKPPGSRIDEEDLMRGGQPSYDPSFEAADLLTSVLLRWEYRLGSTLFFVWSHGQDAYVEPGLGSRTHVHFNHLAPRRANEAFVLKLSYWWG